MNLFEKNVPTSSLHRCPHVKQARSPWQPYPCYRSCSASVQGNCCQTPMVFPPTSKKHLFVFGMLKSHDEYGIVVWSWGSGAPAGETLLLQRCQCTYISSLLLIFQLFSWLFSLSLNAKRTLTRLPSWERFGHIAFHTSVEMCKILSFSLSFRKFASQSPARPLIAMWALYPERFRCVAALHHSAAHLTIRMMKNRL